MAPEEGGEEAAGALPEAAELPLAGIDEPAAAVEAEEGAGVVEGAAEVELAVTKMASDEKVVHDELDGVKGVYGRVLII